MLVRSVAVAAILAVTGSAMAAPFAVKLVDANSDSLGGPITAAGTLYQETQFHNSDFAPNSALIGAFGASIAEDSYVTIDSLGPSTATYTAAGPAQAINTGGAPSIFTANSLAGTWFFTAPDGTPSSPNGLFGGADAVFLARMTVQSPVTGVSNMLSLSPEGVVIDIVDSETPNTPNTNSLLGRFTAFDTNVTEGVDGGTLDTGPYAQPYQLKVIVSAGEFGTIHDLYVVAIPTPGAASLLGIAGLAAVRRRRG